MKKKYSDMDPLEEIRAIREEISREFKTVSAYGEYLRKKYPGASVAKRAARDKYACFQWIRDARAQLDKETEHMTPEEQVAYIHSEAERILKTLPKLTPEEARRERERLLRPEPEAASPAPARSKSKTVKKTAARRKSSKQPAYA